MRRFSVAFVSTNANIALCPSFNFKCFEDHDTISCFKLFNMTKPFVTFLLKEAIAKFHCVIFGKHSLMVSAGSFVLTFCFVMKLF